MTNWKKYYDRFPLNGDIERKSMKSTGVEKILGELKDLLEEGEELVRNSSGDVRKKGREVRHDLTEALESAREACHRLESQ